MAAKHKYLGNQTGELIASRRKVLGLTLEALADVVKVKPPTIHRYEKGTSKPQDEHVTPLANALGVTVHTLAEAIKQDRFLGSGTIVRESVIDLSSFEGYDDLDDESRTDVADDIALAIERAQKKQRRRETTVSQFLE